MEEPEKEQLRVWNKTKRERHPDKEKVFPVSDSADMSLDLANGSYS